MNRSIHVLTLLSITALIAMNIFADIPMAARLLSPLGLAILFCFVNILLTRFNVNRLVSLNAFGTIVTAFCAALSVFTGQAFLMDISIAWAIQSFVVTVIFAKLIEGKGIEE